MKTSFNQQNPECIEAVVLKYFIRELKLRKLYHLFFKEIPNASSLYYAVKRLVFENGNCKQNKGYSDDHNPFKHVSTFKNIVDTLVNLNNGIDGHHGRMMPPGMPGIDHNSQVVSMTINHLIHFILECNVRSMETFNSVGQAVFNNTCNYLYGAEYTNEQNRIEEEQRQKVSTPEGLRSTLWNLYMEASASGYKGSFDDFMASYNNFVQTQQNADPYANMAMASTIPVDEWDELDEIDDLPDWGDETPDEDPDYYDDDVEI